MLSGVDDTLHEIPFIAYRSLKRQYFGSQSSVVALILKPVFLQSCLVEQEFHEGCIIEGDMHRSRK